MALVETVASIVLNGLQQGAIFALLGIGMTIIFGTMDFLNLAHGALYLIGAYAGMVVLRSTELRGGLLSESGITVVGLEYGFLMALVLVPLVGFVVGVAMERFVADPFYDRPHTDQLLVTFGIALIIQEVLKGMMGDTTYQSVAVRTILGVDVSGPVSLPVVGSFPQWRLYIILIALVIIGLTYLIIEQTDFGLVVRAGTHDAEMVRLMGIKITRSYLVVFGLGAALAALAGLIGASIQTISPQIGIERALVPAFLVIVVGGAGSVVGAIVGGMVLGFTIAAMTIYASQWAQIVMYAAAAVVLLAKPQGLFGSVEVEE